MSALKQHAQDTFATLAFAGAALHVLPSGAVYWPARRTLLVADLHFEKLSSFARSGQLLPPYDTGLTLGLLEADIAATGAQCLRRSRILRLRVRVGRPVSHLFAQCSH